MEQIIKGKVLKVGDNVDTDQILPGKYLELTDPSEIGSHCLSGIDEQIPETFEPGGIVVAGRNFGCGSSREHAAIALKNMGASCVIAESFARIFYRNGINLGLPLIAAKGITEAVSSGDLIELDIARGTVKNYRSGKTVKSEPLTGKALEILSAGGVKKMMLDKRRR